MTAIKVLLLDGGNPTHDQLRRVWLVSNGYSENPNKPKRSPHTLTVGPGEAPIVTSKASLSYASKRLQEEGFDFHKSTNVMVAGKKTEGLVVRL